MNHKKELTCFWP